jgi:hypothetical protein
LWAQHWAHKRFSPAIVRSQDNRRFAVSSLTVTEWTGKTPYFTEDETDTNHNLEQNIQIFETASGTPIQSLKANPVVASAQNFSLSPDGRQFAILHDSQIKLYDLPKIAPEERARFAALEADAPGLFIVSKPGEDSSDDADDIPDDVALPTPGAASTAANDRPSEAQTTAYPPPLKLVRAVDHIQSQQSDRCS